MDASAAPGSATRASNTAVPPRVPPRRKAPATSGAEPSDPQIAPTSPPTASSHWPKAKPIATATTAAATSPNSARRNNPVAATPSAVPSPTKMPIVYQAPMATSLRPGLMVEPGDHGKRELRCPRAVDDAMVERDADIPHRAHDYFAVAHDRARPDAMDAEDADFGVVHERRHEQAGKLAGTGHRERRAAQVLGAELAGTCLVGERVDV